MTPQETFVTRLRRHRQRCRVSLEEIAAETCIKQEMLEALEKNDLSGWPRGLYARAWIRSYAAALGLDADDTVNEFCRLFPHGDRRARHTMTDLAAIAASESAWRDEFTGEDRRRPPAAEGAEGVPAVAPAAAPVPAWTALAQMARAIWGRVGSPQVRLRRSPGTSAQ